MDSVARKNKWRDTIERCLSSGISIRKWCMLNEVSLSTMYCWMAKFRKEEPDIFPKQNAGKWIEVTKENLATSVALACCKTNEQTVAKDSLSKAPDCNFQKVPIFAPDAICAHVNGIKLSIPSGTAQVDIECVFKAARSI